MQFKETETLKNMFRIYLAGPISGLDHKNAVSWREEIVDIFSSNQGRGVIHCLSPMRSKEKLINKGTIDQSYEQYGCMYSDRGIISRDFHDCTTSDLVIFNLYGAKKISIGTIMELAWCYQAKIPTIVIMSKKGNIHNHPMVREATNFRVDSIEEAAEVAISVLGL